MAINNVSLGEIFTLTSLDGKVNDRVQRFEKYDLIKDVVLLTPGVWNGKNYTSEELANAFYNTDWSDPNILSIIADHNDDDENHIATSIHDWLGYVENPRIIGTNLLGDVRLYDPEQRNKVVDAKAKFGISAKLQGMNVGGIVKDFTFKNFSVVTTPACKNAYFNLSQEEQLDKQVEYDKIFFKNKLTEEDSIKLQGGKNNIKMTGEELKNTPKAIQEEAVEVLEEVKEKEVPEVKEEVKEDIPEVVSKEDVPEVVPEVVKEIEEPKEEPKEDVPESKEELSNEKLSQEKLSEALSRIEKLELKFSNFEKLSQEKLSEKPEVVKEETPKDNVTEKLSFKESWAGFNGHAGVSQSSYELANLIIGKYSK